MHAESKFMEGDWDILGPGSTVHTGRYLDFPPIVNIRLFFPSLNLEPRGLRLPPPDLQVSYLTSYVNTSFISDSLRP